MREESLPQELRRRRDDLLGFRDDDDDAPPEEELLQVYVPLTRVPLAQEPVIYVWASTFGGWPEPRDRAMHHHVLMLLALVLMVLTILSKVLWTFVSGRLGGGCEA